jgi:hypothetical protein
MAKRLNLLVQDLPPAPDLFVLEFAVNDYQGQDHEKQLDFKMDVFFEGFERLATCAETVLVKLLSHYPNAAIVFLELRTAVQTRKTAAVLHYGAASHYGIPILSYDQTMFPDYQKLLHLLEPYHYSKPIGDDVLPYPHGCAPCIPEHIIPQFRPNGCASVCIYQRFVQPDLKDCTPPPGREPCYVPFFAHDEVHPSSIGHQIVTDLIVEAIVSTGYDLCHFQQQQQQSSSSSSLAATADATGTAVAEDLFRPIPLPNVQTHTNGWMVADPQQLLRQNDFIMVNDTYEIFMAHRQPLEATTHTEGFTLYDDKFGRPGWIATNPQGQEMIQFDLYLPTESEGQDACYVPYLAFIKSYENMGLFTVTLENHDVKRGTQQVTSTKTFDAQWAPRISIPHDVPLADDTAKSCTGRCTITIRTQPQQPDRKANKVKLVTLSVRKCVV